jgi:hypothetical protein
MIQYLVASTPRKPLAGRIASGKDCHAFYADRRREVHRAAIMPYENRRALEDRRAHSRGQHPTNVDAGARPQAQNLVCVLALLRYSKTN